MPLVNSEGYVIKRRRKKDIGRDTFLVKACIKNKKEYGILYLGGKNYLLFPEKYIGRRIKLKVEIVK